MGTGHEPAAVRPAARRVRHDRDAVVRTALAVLDAYGLGDLSMRRLGAELRVQPSALYHHFPSKQALLGAVADEVLRRGRRAPRPLVADADADAAGWPAVVTTVCAELRDAMLAYRDGGELVATVHAFGLGARQPHDELVAALRAGLGDAEPRLVATAARTLLHFVFGHVLDEQTHLQAASAGALPDDAPDAVDPLTGEGRDFELGLELVLTGIRHHAPRTARA